MHSKYDRFVVFLIVGGSLLMLFGAIAVLSRFLAIPNDKTIASQALQSQSVGTSKDIKPSVVVELSESEKLEKKIIESLILAINDAHSEEDVYKELLKLQNSKPEFELFKEYISFLRSLCQGNVVGYKPIAPKEEKSILLEIMEHERYYTVKPTNYKCFNLVSELSTNETKTNKQEKMNLLVLGLVDGKLEINSTLIKEVLEPNYIARLYAEGMSKYDPNLIANLLYTDLSDNDEFRLKQAEVYIDYYKNNVDINGDNLRIEEARPDSWLISFPKKSLDKAYEETHATETLNINQTTTMSQPSSDKEMDTQNDKLSESGDELTVKPFNVFHFSPNYLTRMKFSPDRHYAQLLRRNGNIFVFDYLPLNDLAGAWHVSSIVDKQEQSLDFCQTLHLADIKRISPEKMEMNELLYNEAIYSLLIKPRLSREDKVRKIYSHVLNFVGPHIEVYSFLRRNESKTNPLVDMVLFNDNKFTTDSPIKIGMKRSELLELYPSLAMANYRLILGKSIMELHFDNQTKSGITMTKKSADDRLTQIMYYNIEWFQQDFDLASLHYVS